MTAVGIGTHSADFDPRELSDGVYASRTRRGKIDVVSLLCVLVMLLFLLPYRLIVPQMSNFGRPALLMGLVLVAVWAISRIHRRLAVRGHQPMRWVAAFYIVSLLLSYVAGIMRGLPPLEANGAERAIVLTLIFVGVILATSDGVLNRTRLDDLLRVLVWCGGIMALIGNIQFVTNIDITEYMKVPGLALINEMGGLEARTGYFRVASTANHYIEFSVVMAMLLPFAIHLVRFAPTRPTRQLAGVMAVLMLAAIPATLSRSGMLAVLATALIMFPFWPWRTKFNIGSVGLALLAVMALARPGFLGTLLGLFENMGDDPSISGRTNDYAIVGEYFAEAPIFGRGFGTFIPKLYIILDNQFLWQLISGGILGLLAMLFLHGVAISLGVYAYRRSTSAEDKHLALSLVVVQIISMLMAATFDSMSFTTFSTCFALLTGMTGALWRLTHSDRDIRHTVYAGRAT